MILRIGGIVVGAVGMSCLPIGYRDDERALSVFHNIVDMGFFTKIGLIMLGLGLVAFVSSFLLRGEMGEDY
jgi:hypothetical protein